MKKFFNLILTLIFCLSSLVIYSQTLKEQALSEFKNENYTKAVALLKEALKENPNDSELYYYLGYFTHYLCYDSVAISGYDSSKSDEILYYLQKAIEINPNYGNALYFIGVEYGARARYKLLQNNISETIEQYKFGKEKGGYPDWLLEYAKNILNSCEKDAILFVSGDAEVNPLSYLQFIDKYRTDISIVSIPLLERPLSALLYKTGIENLVKPLPISWSNDDILNMRPFKWKTNFINIPIPDRLKEIYKMDENEMNWEIKPNLIREDREYLSSSIALLADIIKTNKWKGPIYFSMGCQQWMYANLESHLQLNGIVFKLLPINAKNYNIEINTDLTEKIITDKINFISLREIKDSNMPKASNCILNYYNSAFRLIYKILKEGDKEKAKLIFLKITECLPDDLFLLTENYKKEIENIKHELNN